MSKYELITADVVQWGMEYKGPKFHAILSDFPYGLEFMGKEWDKFDVRQPEDATFHKSGAGPFDRAKVRHATSSSYGNSNKALAGFQQHVQSWGDTFLPHLYPGAISLVFGGTRTWHRLAVGMEDAGFEIWDTLMWLYGCLSEDTEILINGQWEPYSRATEGSHTLSYDITTDTFSWQPIEKIYVYDYADTAYRIQSDHTDQIVSRNHRCIVERDGEKIFQFAEQAAQESEIRVPVLEDLQGLLQSLPLPQSQSSTTQQNMFDEMRNSPHSSNKNKIAPGKTQRHGKNTMYGMPENNLASTLSCETNQESNLFAMQWNFERKRVSKALLQRSGRLDEYQFGFLQNKNDRGQKSGMERRSDLLPQARQLQTNQIYQMPTGVHVNGEERWICDGAPINSSKSYRKITTTNRSSASRQSRPAEQPTRESDVVRNESRSQTVRATRYTRTDLARITPFHYTGKVWCVKVPTGAFVARRNGKVFITGNSGFPKAQDLSKLIDKKNGDTRTVIGRNANYHSEEQRAGSGHNHYGKVDGSFSNPDEAAAITAPGSEISASWAGYKTTALKPAWEPILAFKKPLEDTYAETALKYGSGALNIDATRIAGPASTGGSVSGATALGQGSGWNAHENRTVAIDRSMPAGRYPANLILECTCAHTETVTVKPHGSVSGNEPSHTGDENTVAYGEYKRVPFTAYPGVAERHTDPDCPAAMLDEQTGDRPGCKTPSEAVGPESIFRPGQGGYQKQGPIYPDTGGASRFFKVVNSKDELCQEKQHGDISENLKVVGIENGENPAAEKYTPKLKVDGCGSELTEQYQKDMKSIIKTKIEPITNSQTLNSFSQKTTMNSTELNDPTTSSLTESSTADVKNAMTTSQLPSNSNYVQQEISKDTALNVKEGLSKIGETKTEKNTIITCENIEKGKEISRFFYCAKASSAERHAGVLNKVEPQFEHGDTLRKVENKAGKGNNHPTVKPINLAIYLAKLLLPPASVGIRRILVPFSGSGSEIIGCLLAGWDEVVGVEISPEYNEIAKARCDLALAGGYDKFIK